MFHFHKLYFPSIVKVPVIPHIKKTASAIQENAEDIYAEAQQINEDRAAAEEAFEDTAEEETFKETEETAAEEE